MAGGAVPDVWRARRAALSDQAPRRQADPLLARRTRLAKSPLPDLQGAAGGLCRTPSGRRAGQPHTARLQRGRRELFAEEQVWEELERWEAAVALVRFSGGGGRQGSIAAVTLEDAKGRELARWGSGEGELPEALAAPIWGRYALFRGHPRINGLLMWDVQERQAVIAGERGGQKFEELLSAPRQLYRPGVAPGAVTAGDRSRGSAARAQRDTSPAGGARATSRSCERCGEPLRAGLRPEARYCQTLPAGDLARAPEGPPSLSAAQPGRGVRVVRRADARRLASGGTVQLKALPAGVLPARPQAAPALPGDLGAGRHVALSARHGAGVAADAVGACGGRRCDQGADQGPLAVGRGDRGQGRDRVLLPDLPSCRMAARKRARDHWSLAQDGRRAAGGDPDDAPVAVPRGQLSLPEVDT